MVSYSHNGVKQVKSMYAYGVIDGVKGPLNRLSNTFIAMMFSTLSKGVAGLEGITAKSFNTIRRFLFEDGIDLSDVVLTSIDAFVTAWRAVLGAPRRLFAGGTFGICGREGCASPSITVVGFSDPSFALGQCVSREDVVTAVCDKHKKDFLVWTNPHQPNTNSISLKNVTLKTQVNTLEAQVNTLYAQVVTVEEEKRSVEAQVATVKTGLVTSRVQVGALEVEKRFVEEEKRSLEAQVVTLTTDLATLAGSSGLSGGGKAAAAAAATAAASSRRRATDYRRARYRTARCRTARLVGLTTTERAATRAAEVQTQQWGELEQTDSEEARRVMEECDAQLERMLSGLEL
jgi:hypothetical protein